MLWCGRLLLEFKRTKAKLLQESRYPLQPDEVSCAHSGDSVHLSVAANRERALSQGSNHDSTGLARQDGNFFQPQVDRSQFKIKKSVSFQSVSTSLLSSRDQHDFYSKDMIHDDDDSSGESVSELFIIKTDSMEEEDDDEDDDGEVESMVASLYKEMEEQVQEVKNIADENMSVISNKQDPRPLSSNATKILPPDSTSQNAVPPKKLFKIPIFSSSEVETKKADGVVYDFTAFIDNDLDENDDMLNANVIFSSAGDIVSTLDLWATDKDYFKNEKDCPVDKIPSFHEVKAVRADADLSNVLSPKLNSDQPAFVNEKIRADKVTRVQVPATKVPGKVKDGLTLVDKKEIAKNTPTSTKASIEEQVQKLRSMGMVTKQRLLVQRMRTEADRQEKAAKRKLEIAEVKRLVSFKIQCVNDNLSRLGLDSTAHLPNVHNFGQLPTDVLLPSSSKLARDVYYSESDLIRPCDTPFPIPPSLSWNPVLDIVSNVMTPKPMVLSVEDIVRYPRRRQKRVDMKFCVTIYEEGDWDAPSSNLGDAVIDADISIPTFFNGLDHTIQDHVLSARRFSGFVADYVVVPEPSEDPDTIHNTDSASVLTDFERFQEDFDDYRYDNVGRNQPSVTYITNLEMLTYNKRQNKGPSNYDAPGGFDIDDFYDDDESVYDDEGDNLFNEELHDASASLISNLTFDTSIFTKECDTEEAFDNAFGNMFNAAEKERVSYLNDLDMEQSNWINESDVMDLYSIAEEGDQTSRRHSSFALSFSLSAIVLAKARSEDDYFRKKNRAYTQTIKKLKVEDISDDCDDSFSVKTNNTKWKKKGGRVKNYLNDNKWISTTACRKNDLNHIGFSSEAGGPGQTSIQSHASDERFNSSDDMDGYIDRYHNLFSMSY